MTLEMEPIKKLTRDIKKGAITLGEHEARFLVDAYYAMQEDRIRAGNQIAALTKSAEPHEILSWLADNTGVLERNIKSALDVYSDSKPLGRWARLNKGIGPVITAGLLAHINLKIATNVSKITRFAGLDPTKVWLGKKKAEALVADILPKKVTQEHVAIVARAVDMRLESFEGFVAYYRERGSSLRASIEKAAARRPWNARLKTLCWKVGESFKKVSKSEDAFYGHVYRERKALEVERNEAGQFAELAAKKLLETNIKDRDTKATYKAGRLPAGRLDLRATRYAVKLFLSHYWAVGYEIEHGKKPPNPWIVEHGGHSTVIPPPHWP